MNVVLPPWPRADGSRPAVAIACAAAPVARHALQLVAASMLRQGGALGSGPAPLSALASTVVINGHEGGGGGGGSAGHGHVGNGLLLSAADVDVFDTSRSEALEAAVAALRGAGAELPAGRLVMRGTLHLGGPPSMAPTVAKCY